MNYSGLEIIEIALRIEENGYVFYTAAAEMISEPNDNKSLFRDLAEKEMNHIAIFKSIAGKIESEDFEFNMEEESPYINNLADKHIFGKVDAGIKLSKTIKTPKETLAIALKFENESVEFYEELLKHTKSNAREIIKRIIEEEKEHAAEIRKFL